MKKNYYFLLILIAFFISCNVTTGSSSNDDDNGGSSDTTLTGTVTGGTNVVVGVFSKDLSFVDENDNDPGNDDVVASEGFINDTGSFTPLVQSSVGTGSYSLTLPSDPTTAGDLVAWDDANSDGVFDLGTETGYFAVKNIDGNDQIITGLGYASGNGVTVYVISYFYNSTAHIIDFTNISTSGFNFTID